MPSWSQVEAQVRALFMALAGIAVSFGVIQAGTATTIVGVLMLVVGAIWSWYVNRPEALVKAAASTEVVKNIDLKPTTEGIKIDTQTNSKVKVVP